VNKYHLYFIRKKRFCKDCKKMISDKRYRLSCQGPYCEDCRQNHRTSYLRDYWQRHKALYLGRRKYNPGGARDTFTIETIERSLPKGEFKSLKMVKIVKKRFDAPDLVNFEYEVSNAKLLELRQKYGEKNVIVL